MGRAEKKKPNSTHDREILSAFVEALENCEVRRGDESFRYGLVVLAFSVTKLRRNPENIAKFTGMALSLVLEVEARLKSNGNLAEGKFYADWSDDPEGLIALSLDILVARGVLTYERMNGPDGEPVFDDSGDRMLSIRLLKAPDGKKL